MESIEAWLQQHQGAFGRELLLLAAKHLGLTKTEMFINSKKDIPIDLATNLLVYLKELDAGTPFFYLYGNCLLYTSPSPRDGLLSRMPSSA